MTEVMAIFVHCLEKWKGCGLVKGEVGEREGGIRPLQISLAQVYYHFLGKDRNTEESEVS